MAEREERLLLYVARVNGAATAPRPERPEVRQLRASERQFPAV
jgi:hypothetical protein